MAERDYMSMPWALVQQLEKEGDPGAQAAMEYFRTQIGGYVDQLAAIPAAFEAHVADALGPSPELEQAFSEMVRERETKERERKAREVQAVEREEAMLRELVSLREEREASDRRARFWQKAAVVVGALGALATVLVAILG